MIRAAIVCLGLCLPTTSVADDVSLDCDVMRDTFVELVEVFGATPQISEVTVRNGWCMANTVWAGEVALSDAKWRGFTDGSSIKFGVDIGALGIADQVFAATANAQFDLESSELVLKEFSVRAEEGHGLSATGSFTLGPSDQIGRRIAEATLGQLSAQAFVNRAATAGLGIDVDDIQSSIASNALSGVDFGQVNRQSQREVLRFVGALPDVHGRLDVDIETSQAIEITQLILPFIQVSEDDVPQALSRALDGVQVDLRWNPGRM